MYLRLRSYLLLLIGFPLAFILDIFLNNQTSLIIIFLYDLVILGLALVDAMGVNKHKVEIIRQPLARLSVGRDNIVSLQVTSGQSAIIEIKDDYPQKFPVSTSIIQATLPANTVQDLNYTIQPVSRGEY